MNWEEFFEEATHFCENNADILNISNRSFTHLGRSSSKIKEMHSTIALDDNTKRCFTPVKTPSELKSKYEMFKENYHKPTPSDVRHDHHQALVNIDNTQ